MKVYNKKTLSDGIAIGRVFNYINNKNIIRKSEKEDSDVELLRLNDATEYLKKLIIQRLNSQSSEATEAETDILNAHLMILEDALIFDYITKLICLKKVNAEYAVHTGFKRAIKSISESSDTYIKDRIDDFKDICNQIIEVLISGDLLDFDMYGLSNDSENNSPIIFFADSLSPSELIKLDKSNICAFVINKCPENSHTAILIKSLNVPLLVGKRNNITYAGKTCIVDGTEGTLYIDPTDAVLNKYYEKKTQYDKLESELTSLFDKETITKGGRKINLYANIGSPMDLKLASENGAEGIGLLRSEVIYLQSNDYPDEDVQFEVYCKIISAFKGKTVTIRTLDINYDKLPEYIDVINKDIKAFPRGLEFCLQNKSIFKVQLRAILRASAFGDVSILYPMVNSKDKMIEVKNLVDEVKVDLINNKIPFGKFKQGAMIETIEGMTNCEDIVRESDFISIGTNDLSDDLFSENSTRLSDFVLTDYKERVLYDSIKTITETAHRHDRVVSICGEIGTNPRWTQKLVKAGIDTISVAPKEILRLRSSIRDLDI